MNITKSIALFVFCLFCYTQIFAQDKEMHKIEGKIFDANLLNPIEGANVKIKDYTIGCTSDSKGYFSLFTPSKDYVILEISCMGYQRVEKKVMFKDKQKAIINIFLLDSVFVSKAVDIVAPKNISFQNQTQRVNTIKAQEIAIAPVQSVNQIIDNSSGIISGNTTGIFSSKIIVTMRGMPANEQGRTLVVMDGMPLNKSDGGSVNWNALNKNNIESITVIKGPGPAKYGSGAMGGVIDIISKKPLEKFSGNINIEYGTYNTKSANMKISGVQTDQKRKRKFYWDINSSGRMSDGYINTPEVYRTIDDTIMIPSYLKEYGVGTKTAYEWGNNNVLELQVQFFNDKRGNGVQVFDDFGAYSRHQILTSILKYKGMFNFLKWQINIFDNSENYFRVYEYMNEGEYKLYEADALRNDRGTQIDMDYYRFKHHKISFGFSGKKGNVNGNDTYYTSTDIIHNAAKMDILAAYIQDDFSIIPNKLTINAGIRYDYARFYNASFSIDYPSYSIEFYKSFETANLSDKKWDALSPRLSICYNLTKNSRIMASAARGFRAPILDDMSRTGNRKGTFAVANPNLKPELINAFEIGGDVLINNKLFLSSSLFYSLGQDFMYYISTGDSVNMGYRLAPIITKRNIGDVTIKGIETEVKYEFTEKFSVFANYTFTDAKILNYKINNANVDSNLTGKYLTDIPQHKISGGIHLFNKIANVSLMAKYYGSAWINEYNSVDQEYFFTNKFPGYLIFNIRLEKIIFKKFTTSIQVENIFNKKYVDNQLQQNPGRMIYGSIGYKF